LLLAFFDCLEYLKEGLIMDSSVENKSFDFAVSIVKLCRYLADAKREFVLSNQLLRSGTSIGANISEAQQAQSKADFIAKMNIALKEAAESKYWIRLLEATEILSNSITQPLFEECIEIEKMLYSIIRTSKSKK
jgi:four helix bundle protein